MNGKAGTVLDPAVIGIAAAGATWIDWLTDTLALVVLILSALWLLMRMSDWIYARFKTKE